MYNDRPSVPDTTPEPDAIYALSGAILAGHAAVDALRFNRDASLAAVLEAHAAVATLESIHATLWALEDTAYSKRYANR